jgi:hypothetical protein
MDVWLLRESALGGYPSVAFAGDWRLVADANRFCAGGYLPVAFTGDWRAVADAAMTRFSVYAGIRSDNTYVAATGRREDVLAWLVGACRPKLPW